MEQKKSLKPLLIGAAVFLGLVLIDLISKWLIENNLALNEKITVIPNFFYITKIYNTKAAFSIGIDSVWGRVLGIAISFIMSALFIFYYVRDCHKMSNFLRVIVVLMAAGAFGNLIDRAFYWENIAGFDGVIDFMEFYFAGGPSKAQTSGISFNPFPVWNFADACLVIGVILFIVYMIVDAIKERKEKSK